MDSYSVVVIRRNSQAVPTTLKGRPDTKIHARSREAADNTSAESRLHPRGAGVTIGGLDVGCTRLEREGARRASSR